ncbi:hypothetical protein QU487_24170 [Crenobacter sp. SG2305]|uniref:hypothetical protein n=1 Tax=Crenobacter oryzisoli TaxID=3056844 RepID=UPI0025AAFD8C|nr:hypothetical protein [Crenobacter sp. SG2305]MDN0085780.1 hypothetical protein [Crenobacter sp. SG2305]
MMGLVGITRLSVISVGIGFLMVIHVSFITHHMAGLVGITCLSMISVSIGFSMVIHVSFITHHMAGIVGITHLSVSIVGIGFLIIAVHVMFVTNLLESNAISCDNFLHEMQTKLRRPRD